MESERFLRYCSNESCEFYKKKMRGNIIQYGVQKNGTVRFKCTSCGKTFTKTRSTIYFYKHITKDELKVMCKLLAKKMSFRGIARKTNRHLDTVRGMFRTVNENFDKLKNYFLKDLDLSKEEVNSMSEHLKKKKSKKTFKN
ncbi:hypothetical protein COV13_01495 [Candidatus Woesearchaeota archaeon CG10_big_fil_rev_8_21_14_0_10_32_9]|nr:MAG: hypothetical protein COV13_01495 [Candidatus Woesearchaeota archaeon CG10_big_fil_rev_8_21_14_0_10_32_9]